MSNRIVVSGCDIFHGNHAEVHWAWNPKIPEAALHWATIPRPLPREEFGRLRPRAERQTILSMDGIPSQEWMHSEHAFAAWLFFADLPIELHLMTRSFPLLDGSALPWCEALTQLAASQGEGFHVPREVECGVTYEKVWQNGFLRAEPATHFSVTYTIERGAFSSHFHLETAAEAYEAILPARTFIFADDLAQMWDLKGDFHLDPHSGMLLAASVEEARRAQKRWNLNHLSPEDTQVGLLFPQALRFSDEPARHKILDLMGDLALGNLSLPKLRISAKNAGHDSHHDLLKTLQSARIGNR
jgi:hypothetical protein